MMNTYEERVREFAHQIWESEGRPEGQECRHWDMACKLAEGLNNKDTDDLGSGAVLSVIAAGEPFNPDPEPVPEIDRPQPNQPDIPVPPSPTQQPIQPTDPVQPGNPEQPIQPQGNVLNTSAANTSVGKRNKSTKKQKEKTSA
jgi:hypothetical protein